MRIPGVGGLRRRVRRLKNRLRPGALILAYHRVAEVPSDPQLLCVTPSHFAEHLEVLQKSYKLLRLQQLVEALRKREVPRRAVVITLDDGYADNLYHAKPLLEQYDSPATVFVTTSYLKQDREFWWDELERLLLTPGMLPKTLNLRVNGAIFPCELGDAAHYGEDAYRRYRNWTVADNDEPSRRHTLYRAIHQQLRPLPEGERRRVLDDLLAWAGSEQMIRPTHRTLSREEVRQLVDSGLIEVGAHTVTHPCLSALPLPVQEIEIRQSRADAEELLGRPVVSFAYPYGSYSDYTPETVAIVRETGFECGVANFPGLVDAATNQFELPRFIVRGWDGATFERHLQEWSNG